MNATARIVSPVDGRVWAERPHDDARAVADAVEAAARAQRRWRHAPVDERAACCRAAVDAMLAMGADLVPELAWQMGRPVRHGGSELQGFAHRARHMIDIAATALADIEPAALPGLRRFIRREPLGTVLVIAPWNYPYLTAVNSVIPALMAGNAVILKHATQTFRVGERFAQAFAAAGLPDGLFRHLVIDHAQTAALIGSGAVRQVNFTGSVAAGRRIAAVAAPHFVGVGLELGGKDPAYVRSDAALEHAVENLVDGSFFNAGQSCCGVERIYVAESLHDAFVERFVATTNDYVLGTPLDPGTTLGPMVSAAAAAAVREQVDAALAQGALACIDAARFPAAAPDSAYLAPQVLVGVTPSMTVMREESFGPVVGIMPVRDDDHALALMNDSAYGLTASVWTRDETAARRLGDALECGTVYMNRCDSLDPALAWTGVKDSGRGATLSVVGYEALTRPKSYHLREAP
jgi:acyl-CoA reductase-like NAD-dependent aldehyde dehydrogenase